MRLTKAHLRSELGHWEADLMHFPGQRTALLTCIERRSRFLLTTKLADKKSKPTIDALRDLLNTMTLDNGGEFYQHQRRLSFPKALPLKRNLGPLLRPSGPLLGQSPKGGKHRFQEPLPLQAYFCDPHSPWQQV